MEGPHDNPDETYVTVCGEVYENWGAAEFHERCCPECSAVLYGEPENDADDRGICYEKD